MSDLNRVTLVGRLTRAPELKSTNSGTFFCRFSLASSKTFVKDGEKKENVGFFDCVAWGKLAEIISKHLEKGRRIGIDGSLKFNSWENKEGKKQSRVEIYVETFQFLDGRKSDSQSSGNNQSNDNQNAEAPDDNGMPGDDEEIPF